MHSPRLFRLISSALQCRFNKNRMSINPFQ
uniref:Integrator complex subunit 9 homolog isoform X1 n=1 Tax=Rhizophora mucronata TaxID=61149 RepID=A0A2P2J716_RHIMU